MGKYVDLYLNSGKVYSMVDFMIKKHYGWIPLKDYDDYYSIAGTTVWYCEEHYDKSKGKTFESYLVDSLHRKFKTRITHNNRKKRNSGTPDISIDSLIDEENKITFGDMLVQKENADIDILIERYLDSLTKKQRQVAELMMEGYSDRDIKVVLGMSSEQYKVVIMNMKKDEKITPLKVIRERMRLNENNK